MLSQIVQRASPEVARQILHLAADHLVEVSWLDQVANLQFKTKNYDHCVKTLEKAISNTHDPQALYALRTNLASAYNKLNQPQQALRNLEINLQQLPHEDLYMEQALSYYFLGETVKSEQILQRLLDSSISQKTKDHILYNLAIHEMERNDFTKGYYQYIHQGHKLHVWPTQQLAMVPLWKGEVEPGKTILIHAEGGIGDEIIGVRFMQHIQNLGMKAVWHTNNVHLHAVFNRCGFPTILQYNQLQDTNVAQCMAMYLPSLLKLTQQDIWHHEYLQPCDKHVQKWSNILPKGRKLAIRWQGNMHYDQDLHRSIPPHHFQELHFTGTKINLQLEAQVDWAFNPEINTIEDTLAILSLCDQGVISSCTSVAHMAGAMGIPTVVCPPLAYYYTWAKGVRWYGDHVKVVRQTSWNDWHAVFSKIQEVINEQQLQLE